MWFWLRVSCFAFCAAGALVSSARAQDVSDVIGQTVVSVTFDVEGRADETPSLSGLSAVKVGEPLRSEDVRSSIARLDGLGLYDGVAAVARPVAGGVADVFQLDPRHPVTALQLEGNTGISPGSLRRLLQQRYGGVPTTTRPSAVEATTVQMLNDEGYLGARVSSRTELVHDPDAATLVLQVEAGPLTAIRSVVVRGESPRPPDDIIRETRTSVGSPFRRREIERALTTVEEDLRQRGYYEAQLTLQTTPTAEGVDVVLGVSAGPRVEVRVQPDGALPGDIDEFVPIQQQGSADRDLLEDSRVRIERALRADGYWKAAAPFTTRLEDGGALLVITFAIERGPRYFVERVDVPSTLALPGAELQKLIGVSPGSVFDEDSFLAGLARVAEAYRRAGYYTVSAEPTYEEVASVTPGARAVVVLYPMITEGPAGRLAAVSIDAGATPQVPEVDIRHGLEAGPALRRTRRRA
jgi:outer membrane protein assembly factor BamA